MIGGTGARHLPRSPRQAHQRPAGPPTPALRCRRSWSQPAATSSHRVSIEKSGAARGCEPRTALLALLCSLAALNVAMSLALVKLYQEVGPLVTIAVGVSLGLLWAVLLSSTFRWVRNLLLGS